MCGEEATSLCNRTNGNIAADGNLSDVVDILAHVAKIEAMLLSRCDSCFPVIRPPPRRWLTATLLRVHIAAFFLPLRWKSNKNINLYKTQSTERLSGVL